jgi:hypothetical protein
MSYTNKDIWDQLSCFVSIIPQIYVDTLLSLHEKLEGKDIKWVIDGDLTETLRKVKVEPECIEIVTSRNDAKQIFQTFQEFSPSPISLRTQQLERNALAEGKEYPVYVRSYYFDFNLNNILVKVNGDLQYKVADWDWGDIYTFDPECVYVVGKKIAVTPLAVKHQLYECLGWVDRAEKIEQIFAKWLILKNK